MIKALILIFFAAIGTFVFGQQWKNLGPCGSDTYGNHVAPQGGTGQIHCIFFDPDSQNIVYAGSPFGGLWKSVDSGKSWSDEAIDVDQSLEFASISDIAITKSGSVKTLWVATGHPSARGDAGRVLEPFSSGLYTSTNGGLNFKPVTSFNKKQGFQFINRKRITRIVAHPTRPEIIFVATSDGLYQTIDGGTNWKLVLEGKELSESYNGLREKQNEGMPITRMGAENETSERGHPGAAIFSVEFSKTDPDNVVYASGNDIYRSEKGGKKGSFKSMTHERRDLFGDSKDCLKSITMNIEVNTVENKDVMYAAAFIRGDSCGIYKNKNDYNLFYFDGGTWSKKTSPPMPVPDGIRLKMASVPGHPEIIYAGSALLSVSSDFGKTWKKAVDYNQPGHADIHAIKNIPGTPDILSGTDGGIFKYAYADQKVEEYNNGLCLGQVIAMGTSASDSNRILIGMQDVGADLWDGKEWTKLPASGDGYSGQLIDYSNDMNFFSCHNGQFLKNASDKGIALKSCNVCSQGCPTAFAQDPNRPNIFYFGRTDVYKSVDSGKTWCRISEFNKKVYINPAGNVICDIEIAPGNPDIIFASFNASPGCCNSALFKSVTGGGPCGVNCNAPASTGGWTLLNIPKIETGDGQKNFEANGHHYISSIAVSDKSADKFWLGFSYFDLDDPSFKVFKTEDNGATWEKDDDGLPDYPISKLVYVSGSDDELFAGSWNGVYHKKGDGAWEKYGTGLPHVFVSDMEINYRSHKLRVSTYGRGVWEIELP